MKNKKISISLILLIALIAAAIIIPNLGLGGWQCHNCRTKNTAKANYCSGCGASVYDTWECHACGHDGNSMKTNKCSACGFEQLEMTGNE